MSVTAGQRHIPDTPKNRQFDAVFQAMQLAAHTVLICKNKNIFIEAYDDAITHDLIETAKTIYIEAAGANDILVRSGDKARWLLRKAKEQASIDACRRLLALTNLARHLFHLRGNKVRYWQTLILGTRAALTSWQKSDEDRYGYLTYFPDPGMTPIPSDGK